MAVLIGRELAAFLLEEHVALDPAARPAEASTTRCPKCGQPGAWAVEEAEELSERRVTTRGGDIRVRRQRWHCGKCRIVFFPLDIRLGLGTEGYSPMVLAKAVRQASKAPSFAEASDDLWALAEVWLERGAEAMLQLRAAQLSQDDRWNKNWSCPRKHRRAVGSGRLAQAV